MATSRLSKEAEVKITNSLSEIAELVNSGANPNEAIAKTASANGIPVGHIELMVRAFNVGRSEAQRQSGAEPHEKLAEFELADPKSVMDIMYPSSVKSASAVSKDSSVSNIYAKAPSSPVKNTLPSLPPLVKTAAAEAPKDTLGEIRQLSALVEKLANASNKLRTDSAQARDKVTVGINKLANYFRSYGSKPFMVVKDNSERLFGKKASALLDILLTSNRHLKKQAGTVSDVMAPVNMDEEPYKSIKSCIDLAELHLNKEASSAYLGKLAKETMVQGFGNSIPSEKTGSVIEGIDKSAAGALSFMRDKLRSGTERGLAKTIGEARNTNPLESAESKDWKFVADQRLQDMQLKNIKARSAIADLMANDEIISSFHPEDIAFHFNEISQLMPESTTSTALMRPLLRKRLAGGTAAIDPYDVRSMLEMSDLHKPKLQKSSAWGQGIIDPFSSVNKKPDKKKEDEKEKESLTSAENRQLREQIDNILLKRDREDLAKDEADALKAKKEKEEKERLEKNKGKSWWQPSGKGSTPILTTLKEKIKSLTKPKDKLVGKELDVSGMGGEVGGSSVKPSKGENPTMDAVAVLNKLRSNEPTSGVSSGTEILPKGVGILNVPKQPSSVEPVSFPGAPSSGSSVLGIKKDEPTIDFRSFKPSHGESPAMDAAAILRELKSNQFAPNLFPNVQVLPKGVGILNVPKQLEKVEPVTFTPSSGGSSGVFGIEPPASGPSTSSVGKGKRKK